MSHSPGLGLCERAQWQVEACRVTRCSCVLSQHIGRDHGRIVCFTYMNDEWFIFMGSIGKCIQVYIQRYLPYMDPVGIIVNVTLVGYVGVITRDT